jgi:hypothetical protein
VAAGQTSVARADTLEQGLLKQAPEVMQYLKDKGYKNVGVLKFFAKEGKDLNLNIGPLNYKAARMLQTALLLQEDSRDPIGLIRDASDEAVKLEADHHTPAGKEKLFAYKDYRLLWGEEKVSADAFVSGVLVMQKDLRSMDVFLCVFDPQEPRPHLFPKFTAQTTGSALAESGRSFVRGLEALETVGANNPIPGAGNADPTAAEKALAVENGTAQNPLNDPKAPVEILILYDGKKVTPRFNDKNEAEIDEPEEGQHVSFVLRKKDPAPVRYGVVLKLNGENTLFKEQLPGLQCRKWILDSEQPEVKVKGYNTSTTEAEAFAVLSRASGKPFEIKYGKDTGQISVEVYQEQPQDLPPPGGPGGEKPDGPKPDPKPDNPKPDNPKPDNPKPDDQKQVNLKEKEAEAEDLAALLGGAAGIPSKPPANVKEAKAVVRKRGSEIRGIKGNRGIVVPGGKNASPVEVVNFKPAAAPVMAVTITYFRPR